MIDLKYLDKNHDYIFGKYLKIIKKCFFCILECLKKSSKKKIVNLKIKKFDYKHIIIDEDYKYIELKNLFKIF